MTLHRKCLSLSSPPPARGHLTSLTLTMLRAPLYSTRPLDERIFDSSSWPYVLARMYLFVIAEVARCKMSPAKTTRCGCFCNNVSATLCSVFFSSHTILVANNDTTLINDGLTSGPPTLKGYLNKYTNVARGYSTRWFVLKDGVLSCMQFFFLPTRIHSFHQNVQIIDTRKTNK
jgi:hypothetical protein